MAELFSLVAMIIMLRESLEAAVVVAILLQITRRMGLNSLTRQVWFGAIAGLVLSLIVGGVFVTVFYVASSRIFSGRNQQIFKGVCSIVGASLITLLALAMLKFMGYEKKWERKLETVAGQKLSTNRTKFAVFMIAFTVVLREGIESVLFLTGTSGNIEATAIPISGIVGVVIGLAIGYAIWYSGKSVKDLKWFFIGSAILLFAIAAGLLSSGLHFFQVIGWFGKWYYECRRGEGCPWCNIMLWNWNSCCPDTDDGSGKSRFFSLFRAIFGYQDQPTALELIAYIGYWLFVGAICLYRWRKGTLNKADSDDEDEQLPTTVTPANVVPKGKVEDGELAVEEGGKALASVPSFADSANLEERCTDCRAPRKKGGSCACGGDSAASRPSSESDSAAGAAQRPAQQPLPLV